LNGHEGAGHYVIPHEHEWQIHVWKYLARCSGRYFCSTCSVWFVGVRCDLAARDAEREARRAERAATATAATASLADQFVSPELVGAAPVRSW
jgi:chloramphenicol 3-O-phosphotransferase